MRKHLKIIIGMLLMVGIKGHAQELKALRHSQTDSSRADFYIALEDKKIKYEDTLSYYWFKSQKIHRTQGQASGKLLHGNYKRFFLSGQLAEQGNFKWGLRDGIWRSWTEAGQLASVSTYKKGHLHGKCTVYDASGEVHYFTYRKGEIKVKEKKEKAPEVIDSTQTEKKEKQPLFQRKEENRETVTEEKEPFYKKWFRGREAKAEKPEKEDRKKTKNKEKKAE